MKLKPKSKDAYCTYCGKRAVGVMGKTHFVYMCWRHFLSAACNDMRPWRIGDITRERWRPERAAAEVKQARVYNERTGRDLFKDL